MSHFGHLKFPKVDDVIFNATFDLGKITTELETLLDRYCHSDAATSTRDSKG